MTSTHRLAALIIIWIVLAVALFYAIGSSLFLPPNTVVSIIIALLIAGIAATYLVMRFPRGTVSQPD